MTLDGTIETLVIPTDPWLAPTLWLESLVDGNLLTESMESNNWWSSALD